LDLSTDLTNPLIEEVHVIAERLDQQALIFDQPPVEGTASFGSAGTQPTSR
jgi:hypothetical protein